MKRYVLMLAITVLIMITGYKGQAQAKPTLPTNYSVTETIGYFGDPIKLQIFRKGNVAFMKHFKSGTTEISSLSFIDLVKHTQVSWDPSSKPIECGNGTFSGSWGDPFEDAASMMDDVNKLNPKQVGAEIFLGLTANVLEAVAPAPTGKMRVWVDAKTGAVLKLATYTPTGEAKVLSEITALSFAMPPDTLFKTPPECAAAMNAPKTPTEDEATAKLTNDDASNYVRAVTSPEGKDSCTMLYKVVQAGTMQPITTGITVSVDIGNVGGSRHKISANGGAGVYRIANIPANFDIETDFGDSAGTSFALIHRQCFGPETVLLYVIKNPAKATDGGDYLWVKSGKYAAGAKK
jgi:hypothetical protein